MTNEIEPPCATGTGTGTGAGLPAELPLTAEAARRLAVLLAPHLMAMRAVTAGTPYAPSTHDQADAELAGRPAAPAVSAATRIFIAGTLNRIPA